MTYDFFQYLCVYEVKLKEMNCFLCACLVCLIYAATPDI